MNRTTSPSSLLPSSHHHISPTSSSTAFSVATMRNTDLTKPKKVWRNIPSYYLSSPSSLCLSSSPLSPSSSSLSLSLFLLPLSLPLPPPSLSSLFLPLSSPRRGFQMILVFLHQVLVRAVVCHPGKPQGLISLSRLITNTHSLGTMVHIIIIIIN